MSSTLFRYTTSIGAVSLARCGLAAVLALLPACDDTRVVSDVPTEGAPRWVGRVDLSAPDAPRFSWSHTGFVAKVTGKKLSVKLETVGAGDDVYFQPVIDGAPIERVKVPYGEQTALIASDLSPGDHVLELYRDSEGKLGYSVFGGFVEGSLKAAPPATDRRIEIIGDSISAGYGNLGQEAHPNYEPDPSGGCRFSTETESAYASYGAVAARLLEAEPSIVALSGWGVYRDNGNNPAKVLSNVYEGTLSPPANLIWGFEPKPQVVVINLGTNDFFNGDPGQAEFQGAYSALVTTVRSKYPDAWIYAMIGPLLHGPALEAATTYVQAAVDELSAGGDVRLRVLDVGEQDASLGTGCDWHPSAEEHQRIAQRLVSAIRDDLGW